MDRAAALAVFNLLAIIDGAATMDDVGPSARFELRYIRESADVLLNSRDGEDLHDLFATLWFENQKRDTESH